MVTGLNRLYRTGMAVALLASAPMAATAAAEWLRSPIDVNDRLRLEELGAHRLRLLDADGEPVRFALCPQIAESPRRDAQVPVSALTRGAELRLTASGALTISSAPGVQLEPPWERLVLDLRNTPGAVSTVRIPDALSEATLTLRSSPNLRQWSRPLAYRRVDGHQLEMEFPVRDSWLSLHILPEPLAAPDSMAVQLVDSGPVRALQWFDVEPDSAGAVTAPLNAPVRGVRMQEVDAALAEVQIASRSGARDAWKARGTWRSGDGPLVRQFNGIGDRQWRLQAQPNALAGFWQIAHDALEIRIPADAQRPIRAALDLPHEPLLDCSSSVWTGRSQPLAIDLAFPDAADSAPADAAPSNVLPWFLLALGGVGILVLLARRVMPRD